MPLIIEDIKLYSVKELAEMLGISTVAILGYVKSGRLKAQMLGGKWMIASDNLKEFLTSAYNKQSGQRKRRFSLRGMIKDGQVDDKALDEVTKASLSLPEVEESFDVTQDPIFQIEGYESNAPVDLSKNLDKYLYGSEYPK